MKQMNLALCSPEGYKVQPLFKEAYPEGQIVSLEVGDILLAEKKKGINYLGYNDEIMINPDYLIGVLIEVKKDDDFIKATEQLERIREELYRMRIWQQKNIYVDLHCVWIPNHNPTISEYRLFYTHCFQYLAWGHIFSTDEQFKKYLKEFGRPKCKYQRDMPFIKRSHEEPTLEAKRFRQIDGVSSEIAMQLAAQRHLASGNNIFNSPIYYKARKAIREVVGFKKDGTPKRLSYKIEFALENGRMPTKTELDDKIAFRQLEEGDA